MHTGAWRGGRSGSWRAPGDHRPRPALRALGETDDASRRNVGDLAGAFEQHRLEQDLMRRAGGKHHHSLTLGACHGHTLRGDGRRGLHGEDVGTAEPRPTAAGMDLLPQPRLVEHLEGPAKPKTEPEARVRDCEEPGSKAAEVRQDRARLVRWGHLPEVDIVAFDGCHMWPAVTAPRGEERAGYAVVGEHARAACRDKTATLQEGCSERRVVRPHDFDLFWRLVADGLF